MTWGISAPAVNSSGIIISLAAKTTDDDDFSSSDMCCVCGGGVGDVCDRRRLRRSRRRRRSREAPTAAPTTTAPTTTLGFHSSGPCTVSGECVSSPNYPSNYGNYESCTIAPRTDGFLSVVAFDTEYGYDTLTVDGTAYSGTWGRRGSRSARRRASRGSRTKISTASGWRVCLVPSRPTLAPTVTAGAHGPSSAPTPSAPPTPTTSSSPAPTTTLGFIRRVPARHRASASRRRTMPSTTATTSRARSLRGPTDSSASSPLTRSAATTR